MRSSRFSSGMPAKVFSNSNRRFRAAFPLIEGEEFDQLVEDIRANGLRVPVWLHPDGSILDGRNRYRACKAARIKPQFETWDGKGSPLEFVISMNLQRRHLTQGQRACVAGY